MTLRETIYEHLKDNGEITYPEVVAYSKKCKERLITGLRFLQSDIAAGRHWSWRRYDANNKLITRGQAWFRKSLKKPIKRTTVFHK